MPRVSTTSGRLARMGFQHPEESAAVLDRLGGPGIELLPLVAVAADPDQAAAYLADLADRDPALLDALVRDEGTAMRLLAVLGASSALGDHLLRHPDHWHELQDATLGSTRPAAWWLRAALLTGVGADPDDPTPTASLPDQHAVDALRVEYRKQLLRVAARDLAHDVAVDDVAAELSDLAGAALEAGLAIARARAGAQGAAARLAVIAMGKCGGHELNYVSDVDVIFVVEPVDGHDEAAAIRAGTLLASNLINVCSEHTGEGTIWPVDAALRPEGKAGPLVRTLASHVGYYERWAKTWEFQALLKARPIAGDRQLGTGYVDRIAPMVWNAAARDGFVADVQAMRRRVIDHIPAREAGRQLKLGPGGLRDVEFAVQLLQLVHGRTDEALRAPTTLSALADLTRGGYVGRYDGRALDEAYRFLRTMEHRMQLARLRRTHVVPDDEPSLRRMARSMGLTKDAAAELDRRWRQHSHEVRRLHEKIFYRPLLDAVAKLPTEEARLTTAAAELRLKALGYRDAAEALRHLAALTGGVSRTAAIQRALLPAMLEWFAESPNPDQGLRGFRQISDALGRTHWYLRLLRDEGQVAQRMATVLSSSRYGTDLLQRAPEGVALLGTDEGLQPLDRAAVQGEMLAAVKRHDDAVPAITAVRAIRRRELFRISSADLLGLVDVEVVGQALTAVTAATLESALQIAHRTVASARSADSEAGLPVEMAIVSMGRFGGHEVGYASDADVMFVFRPLDGATAEEATRTAFAMANELRRLLALPGTDPAVEVDADLRPEGRNGPLVRSLDSYAAYYDRWSQTWEAQALLRAEAVIGSPGLCADFTTLIDRLRYPESGLGQSGVREVRRIKARIDDERLPRGADPNTHLKLGRGGLTDIEWTVQLLQMRFAGQLPGLRTTQTLVALQAAVDGGLIDGSDADDLRAAWLMVSDVRNAITLARGKPDDALPRDALERAAVAHVMGYHAGESEELVNDYLRATRRARQVVDRVFWE